MNIFSLFKRQEPPKPTQCHACGAWGAEAVCHCCKTERPAYTALKRLSARPGVQPVREPLPPCRYNTRALCDCGLRGTCLDAA